MTDRKIDADALVDALSRVTFPRQSGFHISYKEMMDKVKYIINELATPAPEPQESIFDADGWCWDMNKAPSNENVIFYITNLDLKTKRASTGMRVHKEFCFPMVSEKDKAIAWRPMPKLPNADTTENLNKGE